MADGPVLRSKPLGGTDCPPQSETETETDPYYQWQNCRPTPITVSGGIRFIRIFAEVPGEGVSNDGRVVENSNFQLFRWLVYVRKTCEYT